MKRELILFLAPHASNTDSSTRQSEKELAWREKAKQAREVTKIVHAEVPLLPLFSVDEAIHVLKEAVHRLK
jgi:hypothetical protein